MHRKRGSSWKLIEVPRCECGIFLESEKRCSLTNNGSWQMAFHKKPGSLGLAKNSGEKKHPPFLDHGKKNKKTEEQLQEMADGHVSTTSLTGSTSKRCVLRMRPRMVDRSVDLWGGRWWHILRYGSPLSFHWECHWCVWNLRTSCHMCWVLRFFRESSRWILFEASLVPRRNHGHFILFYIFASRTRNSETNWLALLQLKSVVDFFRNFRTIDWGSLAWSIPFCCYLAQLEIFQIFPKQVFRGSSRKWWSMNQWFASGWNFWQLGVSKNRGFPPKSSIKK